jgi:hypothetical protein
MICTKRDNFVENYQEANPCWIVWLASGLVVFQDDGRPGEKHSAWVRLREYCWQSNDYITDMIIKFRSNSHRLPSNADGYYFSHGARGGFGMDKTLQLFFVGTLRHNILQVECWKVPEMLKEKVEERDPEKAGICLISKDMNPEWVPPEI